MPTRVAAFDVFREKVERKLAVLDAATYLEDLGGLPGNRLEALKGDRKGQHSIRINAQWRLCFRWDKADAFVAEIVDYHRKKEHHPDRGGSPSGHQIEDDYG